MKKRKKGKLPLVWKGQAKSTTTAKGGGLNVGP
jgi:hypothetical protein